MKESTANITNVENVVLVGTSHVSSQSVREVRSIVESDDADIVALELDAGRFYALMHQNEKRSYPSPFKVGFKGFFFSILGSWAERMLGNHVGVSPGSEMLVAGRTALKLKKPVVFVDQEIEITLRRLSEEITWREKWNFAVDILKSLFGGGIRERIDLSKVPEKRLIRKLLREVKKRYPSIYKVLVKERNEVIGRNIFRLAKMNPGRRIVAVIGAGHLEEVALLVRNLLENTYPREVVGLELPMKFTASYSFSFAGIEEPREKETDLNRKRS